MKTLLFFVLIFSFTMTQVESQTISTFSGHAINYGWNGAKSEEGLKNVLDKCDGVPELDLQSKVDAAGVSAELLWKISGTLDQVTLITNKNPSSWIWDQAKPDGFTIVFEKDGAGKIYLFQDEKVVGKVRCHTSNKRSGDKYLQLKNGEYKVEDKKPKHVSTEKGLEGSVLLHALYSGVDGKWIHEGEYAPSHGCIRVSKPAMVQLYRLIPIGTPFKVVWNP